MNRLSRLSFLFHSTYTYLHDRCFQWFSSKFIMTTCLSLPQQWARNFVAGLQLLWTASALSPTFASFRENRSWRQILVFLVFGGYLLRSVVVHRCEEESSSSSFLVWMRTATADGWDGNRGRNAVAGRGVRGTLALCGKVETATVICERQWRECTHRTAALAVISSCRH